MQKVCITLVAFLCVALSTTAQSRGSSVEMPSHGTGVEVNLRYSEQISNSPAGTCGCFAMEGAAGDFYWNIMHLGATHKTGLGVAADIGVDHTSNVNGDGYGLTLTTYSAGPRFVLPSARKLSPFAQALFGLAHGSGSQFPQGNSLVSSANSFVLNLGAGADYSLNKRISVRILQLDYLHTDLPNNTSNWQNNLRIGAGLTLHFSR